MTSSEPPDLSTVTDWASLAVYLRRIQEDRDLSFREIAGRHSRPRISPTTAMNLTKGHGKPTAGSVRGFVTGARLDDAAVAAVMAKVEELRSRDATVAQSAVRLSVESPGDADPDGRADTSRRTAVDELGSERAPGRSRRGILLIGVVAVGLLLVSGGSYLIVAGGSGSGTESPPPSAVTVSSFVGFSDDGVLPKLVVAENSLVIETPENDYSALRGAISPAQACGYDLDLDVKIAEPSQPSAGYGLGLGGAVVVRDGTLAGWSIQFEHDSRSQGFMSRAATLPEGASQLSLSAPVTMSTDDWHHLHLESRKDRAVVALNGVPVPGSPFLVEQPCGSILLRVWGTTVTVRDIKGAAR